MIYDREVLMLTVIYHHKVSIEGCICGWAELGKSIGEHVADEYEKAVAAKHGSTMDRLGVTSDEVERCGKYCGAEVISVKDGIAYDPPLRVPASCGMQPGHDGECYP